jgi:hypothetical protein
VDQSKNKNKHTRSPCCLSLCLYLCLPPNNILVPEPIYMKFDIYVMLLEPISTAYFINPSHQSVCLCVYPRLSPLGNGSVNAFPWRSVHAAIKELFGRVVFFAVRLVSKGRVCVSLRIPLSLQGSVSIKTFPLQRRIVWGFVVCAVHVVSKGNRRLVLRRTSCWIDALLIGQRWR